MAEQTFSNINTVAVIGAGVSGISAAIHLKRAGLQVTVYERNSQAGGVWIYDAQTAKDATYPSVSPSVGDSPEYDEVVEQSRRRNRRDSPMIDDRSINRIEGDLRQSFAPPGPCYVALKNNVSTIEMELTCQSWKPGTEEFVSHNVLAEYIQDTAIANEIVHCISFDTRVNSVRKTGSSWEVGIAKLEDNGAALGVVESTQYFDALVIATGHYHACNIPDLEGLAAWKAAFPGSVQHSKLYRSSKGYEGKNVLLVGAGVSSIDIARDLGPVARSVYQSSRGGMWDIPSHLLPGGNGARVGAVESFERLSSDRLADDGSIPGTINLANGDTLCGIHHVILCSGYHISFPLLRQYHADSVRAEDADEEVLVTDGTQTHNLHHDIWWIKDPTLSFIGVPYHVATFSLFEFQAIALAAVFSGQVPLPSEAQMREQYKARIREKGAGRTFHSLKRHGDEIAYVNTLVRMVTARGAAMPGHSKKWHEAYLRRCSRLEALFSKVRDPILDQRAMNLIIGC